jgi:hypothetical protein
METIFVESDDHTYVSGEMLATKENGEYLEPYLYTGALEDYEAGICKTYYYPSDNKFVVYKDDEIIRIVFTSTSWSDDYDKFDIRDGSIFLITITEHGTRKCYISVSNNKISSIIYRGRKFGLGNLDIGSEVYLDGEYVRFE